MRIYKEKKYIIYSPAVLDKPNAGIVTGEELNGTIADGSLRGGDEIYQTHLVATVKEKRELVLQEALPGL